MGCNIFWEIIFNSKASSFSHLKILVRVFSKACYPSVAQFWKSCEISLENQFSFRINMNPLHCGLTQRLPIISSSVVVFDLVRNWVSNRDPLVPCVLCTVQPVHLSMKGCQCLTKCLIELSFINLILKHLQLVLTLRTTQATNEIFCLKKHGFFKYIIFCLQMVWKRDLKFQP